MYLYLLTALVCIVIICLTTAILVCGDLFAKKENTIVVSETSVQQTESSKESSAEASENSVPGKIDVSGYKELSVQNTSLSEGDLILIPNTATATAPAYATESLKRIYDTIPNKIYSMSKVELYLNPDALTALNTMMQEFFTSSAETHVMVHDAYTALTDLRKDENIAAYADLASGRSVRLVVYTSDFGKMGSGVFLWIAEHCHEFGYVLRYPAGKDGITGVAESANCFRYVGIPHAKYMKENNLTLEEYIALIKNFDYKTPLVYTDAASGQTYRIYYQAATSDASTTLMVPGDMVYSVSGNNIDGYIVTVKTEPGTK